MVVAVWVAQLEVASRFMWAGALGGSGYMVWGPVWLPTPTVVLQSGRWIHRSAYGSVKSAYIRNAMFCALS